MKWNTRAGSINDRRIYYALYTGVWNNAWTRCRTGTIISSSAWNELEDSVFQYNGWGNIRRNVNNIRDGIILGNV